MNNNYDFHSLKKLKLKYLFFRPRNFGARPCPEPAERGVALFGVLIFNQRYSGSSLAFLGQVLPTTRTGQHVSACVPRHVRRLVHSTTPRLLLVRMDHEDLPLLLAEIGDFAKSLDNSGLRESDLEDLKLPERSELKLRLQKRDQVMAKVKTFLDSYDSFFNALASTNSIAAPLYGGLKCIVTVSLDSAPHVDAISQPYPQIASAKAEILDGSISANLHVRGLNMVSQRLFTV